MEKHGAILDTSSRIIRIHSSAYGSLNIPLPKHDLSVKEIYHLKRKGVAEISVV